MTEQDGKSEGTVEKKSESEKEWDFLSERYLKLITPFVPLYDHIAEIVLDCLSGIEGIQLLDVGTGPGEPLLTIYSRLRKFDKSCCLVGVDISEKMLVLAQKRAHQMNLSLPPLTSSQILFQKCDVSTQTLESLYKLLPTPKKFDLIVSALVISYVGNAVGVLEKMYQELQPGGTLVLVVWGQAIDVPWLSLLQTALQGAAWVENSPSFFYGNISKLVQDVGQAGFHVTKIEDGFSFFTKFENFKEYYTFFKNEGEDERFEETLWGLLNTKIQTTIGKMDPIELPAKANIVIATKSLAN